MVCGGQDQGGKRQDAEPEIEAATVAIAVHVAPGEALDQGGQAQHGRGQEERCPVDGERAEDDAVPDRQRHKRNHCRQRGSAGQMTKPRATAGSLRQGLNAAGRCLKTGHLRTPPLRGDVTAFRICRKIRETDLSNQSYHVYR